MEIYNSDVAKILAVFSDSRGYNHLRKELKEFTGIPNVILDKNLAKLINLRILKKEKNHYSVNFENKDINSILDVFSKNRVKLKQLPYRYYFIIEDITDNLLEVKEIGDVYLFGSYSKLVFNEKSDIDIAIVSDKVDKKKVNDIVRKLSKKSGKEIEIHFFTKDFYKNKSDALVKDILKNGVKLI